MTSPRDATEQPQDLIAVRRTFFGDFLKALHLHGGHGDPSLDRAYAMALRAEAYKLIEADPIPQRVSAVQVGYCAHAVLGGCDYCKKRVRDWPEDFSDENGNYSNTCHACGQEFRGYKRRVTCKLCADPLRSPLTNNAPVPSETAKEPIRPAGASSNPQVETPYWMRCKTCGSHARSDALGYRVCDGDPETGDRACNFEKIDRPVVQSVPTSANIVQVLPLPPQPPTITTSTHDTEIQGHRVSAITTDERAELERLRLLINTPENEDFLQGVKVEAAHQVERWGEANDRSKSAENWYWLVGYLAGKALRAAIAGDRDKSLHHTISTAAALYQWHKAIKRDTTGAGIGEDADLAPVPDGSLKR